MRCGVFKIMPLGDSITEGFGDGFPDKNSRGYRGHLYQMLVDAGFAVDFVGSIPEGDIPDPDHEGHSGHAAVELIQDPDTNKGIFQWLSDTTPDVVLLHVGTNNIIRPKKQDTDQITCDIAKLLNEIDRYETVFSTVVTVILARIITSPDPIIASEIMLLNKSIESMALTRIAAGDRLVVVDFEKILTSDDFSLGTPRVHPNAGGYRKMAPVWFDALNQLLRNRIIKGWQGPAAFGGNHLQPGAFITPLFPQSESIFVAHTVDRNGFMNVVFADRNKQGWQGPAAFGGSFLLRGAFITPLANPSKTVFAALAVSKSGSMNAVCANFSL